MCVLHACVCAFSCIKKPPTQADLPLHVLIDCAVYVLVTLDEILFTKLKYDHPTDAFKRDTFQKVE